VKNTKMWAVSGLRRNGHYVDTQGRLVYLGRKGPGLKMWRLIDCLCNYFKFHWVREQEVDAAIRKQVVKDFRRARA
jgi:hypothetical protein